MQCRAKSKRTGQQCRAHAIKGKDKCRMHGGQTPIRHGLFSKYPDAIVGAHMEAAKQVNAIETLRRTIPVMAATLSLWVERAIMFAPSNYLATCTLMGRLNQAIETYEKLTNPELRTGKLLVQHDYKNMSDEELIDAISQMHKEADAITRTAAADEASA